MSTRTTMPIMGNDLVSQIPFAMIAPHERQAQRNHYQSLERLAQRGGLSASEALAVLEDRPWQRGVSKEEDARLLINKVREWRATPSAEQQAEQGKSRNPSPKGMSDE